MVEWKLIEEVLKVSQSKEWNEAKHEWVLVDISKVTTPQRCLCTHYPITELIILENRFNKNRIIVGNCCVNLFFGESRYNKVFEALREDRINKEMINISFNLGWINSWEEQFLRSVVGKRRSRLTIRQEEILNDVKGKILQRFKR